MQINKTNEKEEDVLEISIENDIFSSVVSPTHQQITPTKLQQLKYVPPLISPLVKTPLAKTIIPSFTSPIAKNNQNLTAKQIIRQNLFARTQKISKPDHQSNGNHETAQQLASQLQKNEHIHARTNAQTQIQVHDRTHSKHTPLKIARFQEPLQREHNISATYTPAATLAHAQKPNALETAQHAIYAIETDHHPNSNCKTAQQSSLKVHAATHTQFRKPLRTPAAHIHTHTHATIRMRR